LIATSDISLLPGRLRLPFDCPQLLELLYRHDHDDGPTMATGSARARSINRPKPYFASSRTGSACDSPAYTFDTFGQFWRMKQLKEMRDMYEREIGSQIEVGAVRTLVERTQGRIGLARSGWLPTALTAQSRTWHLVHERRIEPHSESQVDDASGRYTERRSKHISLRC
jgi:hypothetical protein